MTNPKNEDQKNSIKSYLLTLAVSAGVLLALIAAAVIIFDPFYHYHGPILGMPAVLNEKEYQVPGTLKNFDYDMVLAGSSVVENNDNSWYDNAFGGTTVKAVRSYGGLADLCWYLELAFRTHNVKRVFFNLDPASLHGEDQTTFELTGCPMYLYDENPLNDVKYLFNKTVLFEKIPYMLAQSFSGSYDPNLSYNWAEGKDFSKEGTLSHYYRNPNVDEMLPKDTYEEQLRANIKRLTDLTKQHPDTEFIFFIPPYSMLWWDDITRYGYLDIHMYEEEETIKALLELPNVRVFDFQNEKEVVTNLDLYMDTLHFVPAINGMIADKIAAGSNELTAANYKQVLDESRLFAESLQEVYFDDFEKQDLFLYDQE